MLQVVYLTALHKVKIASLTCVRTFINFSNTHIIGIDEIQSVRFGSGKKVSIFSEDDLAIQLTEKDAHF